MSTTNSAKPASFLLSFSLAAMLIAILGLVLPSGVSAGSGTWTPTGGPMVNGGQVNAIVVHPTTANTLLASVGIPGNGGVTKIYKSTDGAANWTPVYTGTNQHNGLAITGTLAYAVGNNPLIIKSSDSGNRNTWTPVYTGTQNTWNNFRAVAINPTSTNTVYAVGEEGNGPQESGVVYRTTDGGTTWEKKLNVPQVCCQVELHAVAINPSTPNTVFVAGTAGTVNAGIIYRTTNGGNSWTPVFTSTGLRFTSLLIDPNTPTTVYAGSGWGPAAVYKSMDGGDTWTQVHDRSGFRLAYDPTSNTIYSAADWGEVYKSTDGGDNWNPVSNPQSSVQSLAFDSGAAPASLYAGLGERGVLKSIDGGTNWTPQNTDIQSPIAPRSIAIDPSNPNKIYTGGGFPGGFSSNDGGTTWTPLTLAGQSLMLNAFAINPSNPSVVVAGGTGAVAARILRSADSGANWTGVYTPMAGTDTDIVVLAFDSGSPTNAYAGGLLNPTSAPSQGLVLKSADGGLNWTIAMTKTAWSPGFAALAANSGTVFAGGTENQTSGPALGVIYRSADGGTNWTRVMTSTQTIRSVAIDRWSPNIVYAADDGNVVYKSTDGGNTWASIHLPPWMPGGGVSGSRLVLDPRPSNRVYLAGSGYMGESADGGTTFSNGTGALQNGMPGMDPQSLAVDNGTITQNLYLGLTGVWKYSRASPPATYTVNLPLVSK